MEPLIIGIAGGTGSGKTTIAERIAEALPRELVAIVQHDSYYRDRTDLTFEEKGALNFDHPDALETPLLVEQLRDLQAGNTIEVPIYDFSTHSRSKDRMRVTPRPIVIVEGILVFVDEALRSLFDIKIFVDTDSDIRVFRRIRRDMEQRGRSFQSVREQYYATVRPMHLEFVEPSKRWADVIIPEGGRTEVALDLVVSKARSVIGFG
jgi:uridine kinase